MRKTISNPDDLQALLQRVASLTASDKALWGRMSVGQMICHSNDALRFVLGEAEVKTRIKPPMPPRIYKWIALNTPTKWPKGVPTTPEMCQEQGGTPPAHFEADRVALADAIKTLAAKASDWPDHPMFGSMNEQEWKRWAWLHTDHHLRQFSR